MKCYATVNVFGYPLKPCDEEEEPCEWHNPREAQTKQCSVDEVSRRDCSHHKPAYDPFDAWVEEARSEVTANSRTK